MKNLLTISILVILVVTIGCKDKINGLGDDKCPLSYKLEWQIVEQGIDVEKQIDLLAQLSAAAKADADKLSKVIGKVGAEADFETKFELSKVIQKNEIRKASVSQDVFDEFIRVRASSCALWDAIDGGILGDNQEALKRARDLFISIQEKFSELEKKKKTQ